MAIMLDNGDKIRGTTTTALKVDYLLHGVVGTTRTQLADGQLASSIGDLYTASAAVAVTAITCFNTNTTTELVILYLTPSAGTARVFAYVNLPAKAQLYTDGQKIVVMDASGNIQTSNASMLDNTAGGTDAEVTKAPTSNVMYDHAVLATGVHGVTGTVVGTTDAQTLTSKTLTSPTINGTVATTGLTMPAFISGAITLDSTLLGILRTVDNDLLRLYGGTDVNSATIYLWGKTSGSPGNLTVYTPNVALAATERFRITGGVDTAVATWSNITHTGIVLSGALNANNQEINNTLAVTGHSTSGNLVLSATSIAGYTGGIYLRVYNNVGGVIYPLVITGGAATVVATWANVTHTGIDITSGQVLKVAGTQVVGARVVDARCDDVINSGDATTDGVIDSLRDAMITHGLIAAA